MKITFEYDVEENSFSVNYKSRHLGWVVPQVQTLDISGNIIAEGWEAIVRNTSYLTKELNFAVLWLIEQDYYELVNQVEAN